MRQFLLFTGFCLAFIFAVPSVLAGTVHWGYAASPQAAAAIANKAARKRAKRLRTCITTRAIPGTRTCRIGGPKGWQCYAISANHKGSC